MDVELQFVLGRMKTDILVFQVPNQYWKRSLSKILRYFCNEDQFGERILKISKKSCSTWHVPKNQVGGREKRNRPRNTPEHALNYQQPWRRRETARVNPEEPENNDSDEEEYPEMLKLPDYAKKRQCVLCGICKIP